MSFRVFCEISVVETQFVNVNNAVLFHFQSSTPSFISRAKPTINTNENAKINHSNSFDPVKTSTDHGNKNAISISKILNNLPTR